MTMGPVGDPVAWCQFSSDLSWLCVVLTCGSPYRVPGPYRCCSQVKWRILGLEPGPSMLPPRRGDVQSSVRRGWIWSVPRGGVGGAALGRPVLIDPVSERVGGDVDVGGEPCGQAETVRDVQVEPDVSVAAGGRDLAAPVGVAENLCEDPADRGGDRNASTGPPISSTTCGSHRHGTRCPPPGRGHKHRIEPVLTYGKRNPVELKSLQHPGKVQLTRLGNSQLTALTSRWKSHPDDREDSRGNVSSISRFDVSACFFVIEYMRSSTQRGVGRPAGGRCGRTGAAACCCEPACGVGRAR